MKPRSAIYFFATHPLFNNTELPNFDSFDKDHSKYLYSTFILNHREIVKKLKDVERVLYCFDSKDENFLPERLANVGLSIHYGDTGDKISFLRDLSNKFFHSFENNIFVLFNSIGTSIHDFKRVINLLDNEDEILVLGKAQENKLAFAGFNKFAPNLFLNFDWESFNYDNILNNACSIEAYLYELKGFLTVNNFKSFTTLYNELSKKESLSYCGQEMHERFTQLFIEYKDLLK